MSFRHAFRCFTILLMIDVSPRHIRRQKAFARHAIQEQNSIRLTCPPHTAFEDRPRAMPAVARDTTLLYIATLFTVIYFIRDVRQPYTP
jgi:hypothetical protein